MTTEPHHQDIVLLLDRVRGEFHEMPGMRLTVSQAQRLWQLDEISCVVLLDALVEGGFLRKSDHGHYTREADGTTRGNRRVHPV